MAPPSATPPPMSPLIPCLTMKSSPRGVALWNRVVLPLVRDRGVPERLEDDLDLLLEQLAVGRLVEQRRAEGVDLPRVVAAPDAEAHPAAGEHVGHCEILGEPERMPHRRD